MAQNTAFYEVAQNLYNINYYNTAFYEACCTGQLHVAQWLYENQPMINIYKYTNLDSPFSVACIKGHLHVAQWLYKVQPDRNVSKYIDSTISMVCCNNHLDVAKWLLKVIPNVDLSAVCDWTCRYVCRYGMIDIALWLRTLYPYKYYITEYNQRSQENSEISIKYHIVSHANNKLMMLYIMQFNKYLSRMPAILITDLLSHIIETKYVIAHAI